MNPEKHRSPNGNSPAAKTDFTPLHTSRTPFSGKKAVWPPNRRTGKPANKKG
jgi:hypothetical protein